MSHLFAYSFNSVWIAVLILIFAYCIGGMLVVKSNVKSRRTYGWIISLILMVFVHILFLKESAGFRMFALIVILLQCMKMQVAIYRPNFDFNWKQWTIFSFASVQMDPSYIFKKSNFALPDWKRHIIIGAQHVFIGMLMLIGIQKILSLILFDGLLQFYIVGFFILMALSQILHFGLLRINTGLLRYFGYPAKVIFRQPMKSQSLREFWGKRWNIAFTDMTQFVVYRPLIIFGRTKALLLAFLFSGLLHEIAISVSVMNYIGLPMIYFCIHAGAIYVEKKLFVEKDPGIWWVLLFLILPLPLLFHVSFMQEIIWPFIYN